MIVQPSQPISIVRDQIDATGMPAANTHTATLWKNGATTAVEVTRTNPTTGVYKFAWTIPADAAENDVFSLRVVDGDGYASTVWEAQVGVTAVLDSAVRVKLDGTQPDYAPATASALTTVGNNVTAILEDTGTTIPAQITALNNLSSAQVVSALGTGTWATALPWNAAWDAEVQSEVQDAIEVNNLDHLVKIAVDTNFATTVHLDSVIGHMADNGTTATFSRTTDSLEAIRDNQTAGSGASLPDIIAGVQSVSGAIVEAQNSATLSIRIGDTWTQDIESLGDLTDKTVSFALKKRASDADTAAIVFIVEGTGLTKLNGAATTAGWGSITILDEVAGDIRLRLESNATSLLTSGSYVDAVKVLENGDDRTLRNAGRTVVSAGVIADIT